ncbi:PilX N-terminal domain-containing pilus assembly protein [Psychrobacter sp. B38]|uniref:PilX N-terminal domain-containing pilus assembly protein n=1 Tax=Psychrobacter sp. B38 TaxID=3143538 RepID=UPI00320EFFCF
MVHQRYLSTQAKKNVSINQTYGSTEQGATLIVVLLFLVLIMLAGVIAVRQSNTDLKIATSDQINTVLLQSADSANQKLEMMINGNPTSPEYKDATSASGVFGHFLLDEKHATNEFIYCFNPRTQTYVKANATIKDVSGGYIESLNNGICDYTNANDYTSARQTVMTQMSVTTTPPEPNAERFGHMVIGKEIEDRTSKKYKFDVRATSVLPAYSEPKVGSTKCLDQTSIKSNVTTGNKSLSDCLLEASTPSKMLYEQAEVENVSSSTICIPFGRGALSSQCLLLAANP